MKQQIAKQHSSHIKIEDISQDPQDSGQQNGFINHFNKSRIWSESELYCAAAFVYFNSDKFASQYLKKYWKVYKLMSLFVKTRNVNQCRSYFHKLMRSFNSIEKINDFFRESLPLYSVVVSSLKKRNELLLDHGDMNQAQNLQAILRTQLDKSKTSKITVNQQSKPQDCSSKNDKLILESSDRVALYRQLKYFWHYSYLTGWMVNVIL